MNYFEDLQRQLANSEVDENFEFLRKRIEQASGQAPAVTLRNELERPLTIKEMDANFTEIEGALNGLLGDASRDAILRRQLPRPLTPAEMDWNIRRLYEKAHEVARRISNIGTPGQQGFGVGICPALPDDFSEMAGSSDPASENYGNYVHESGSIMCWIPAFYYKIGLGDAVDIKPLDAFVSTAAANDQGYALHRTFIDGGKEQLGMFVDKYGCSNSGGVAVSKPLQPPLSSHATHNPFADLNGSPANNYSGAFAAVKTRGVQFFPTPRYCVAALALLSLAHGQAATSDAFCAWYDAGGTTNFPKGNNAALRDTNDASVTFISDGFDSGSSSMPALTGSGSVLAKTTHNGQLSGVADLNGNMYSITPGLTCLIKTTAISAIGLANPVTLTVPAHGGTSGDYCMIASVGGTTTLNNRVYRITVIDENTVSLDGVDGSGFAAYTGGGSAVIGSFYTTKTDWSFANYGGGTSQPNDHWSAAGIAASMEPIDLGLVTQHPNNGFEQRFGNADNQVLDMDVAGPGYQLACLGIPSFGGASTSGTYQFGQDRFYQYVRNLLCPLSGLYWNEGSRAGVWGVILAYPRSFSHTYVGVRAASYLVP